MKRKNTNTEIIERFINKHGDDYGYDRVNYQGRKIKLEIFCKKCKEYFFQSSYHHESGCGCPKCGQTQHKIKSKTLEMFIIDGNIKFNNKFDYSKFIYVSAFTKGIIICPNHGEFEQTPDGHLRSKYGCKDCSIEQQNISSSIYKRTKEDYLIEFNKLYNNFYNYDKFIVVNFRTKGIITCPDHGDFEKSPSKHLNFQGCLECNNKRKRGDYQLYVFYDKKYNLYKIGISVNYLKRLKDFNSIISENIDVIFFKENFGHNERKIHNIFSKYRTNHPIKHGGHTEWFDFKDINIDEVISKIDNFSC